jgi:hypothetical protein
MTESTIPIHLVAKAGEEEARPLGWDSGLDLTLGVTALSPDVCPQAQQPWLVSWCHPGLDMLAGLDTSPRWISNFTVKIPCWRGPPVSSVTHLGLSLQGQAILKSHLFPVQEVYLQKATWCGCL